MNFSFSNRHHIFPRLVSLALDQSLVEIFASILAIPRNAPRPNSGGHSDARNGIYRAAKSIGQGGMERMIVYPILLWATGFGGRLIGYS